MAHTRYWIDTHDTSDLLIGDGPIDSVVSWSNSLALNQVGKFTTRIPASERRLQYVQMMGYLHCYALGPTGVDDIGVGIVYKKDTVVEGGMHYVDISGDLLGAELNYRTVGEHEISEMVRKYPKAARWHIPTEYLGSGEDEWNVRLEVETEDIWGTIYGGLCDDNFETPYYFNREGGFPLNNYFYFGNEEPFFDIKFWMGNSKNSTVATWLIQYLDGRSMGWQAIRNWTDGTKNDEGKTFQGTGVIAWTEEELEDWTATTHNDENLYWIRMTPTVALDDFDLTEVQILQHQGTLDQVVQSVLDYAPDDRPTAWVRDGLYDGDPFYIKFSGETVLQALTKIAEQSGNFFTISPTSRTLRWLGNTGVDVDQQLFGISRETGAASNPDAGWIISLTESQDASQMVTRIYPYGSGNGPARFDLTEAEKENENEAGSYGPVLDDEFSFVYDENYIENITKRALYGLIEREVQFNEISPIYEDLLGISSAVDQLLHAAYNWLKARSGVSHDITCTVTGLRGSIEPGNIYDVEYLQGDDLGLFVDIRGEFTVTKVTRSLTVNGETVKLDMSDNPLRKTIQTGMNSFSQMEQSKRYQARRQKVHSDNVLKEPSHGRRLKWLITTAVEDPDGDISPLAKALYRAMQDREEVS